MKKHELTDHELILGYLSGNDSSFEKLVNRYKRKVFSVIYFIVDDRYIAEEIFQETFIKVIQHLRDNRYQHDQKFGSWANSIARNMALDYLRKAKVKPTIVDSQGEDIFSYLNVREKSCEEKYIDNENKCMVRDLIKKLPKLQQEVVILKHYGRYSFKEISEMTNVSLGTALGRMHYALANLRKMMIVQKINMQ